MELQGKKQIYQIDRDFHNALASSFQIPDIIRIEDWEKPLWNYIEELVGEVSGKTVLDVGCGFGREAILFALKDAVVTGIDFSDISISKAQDFARRLGVSVTLLTGNVDSVTFDERFDLVFCRAILHHLPHPKETLKRLSQLIKRGGLLIAQEPKEENPIAQMGRRFFNPTTPTEHAFKEGELESLFCEIFNEVGVKYFFLLSPLCFVFEKIQPLRNTKLRDLSFKLLTKLDEALLVVPVLRKKYTWIEIIYGKVK